MLDGLFRDLLLITCILHYIYIRLHPYCNRGYNRLKRSSAVVRFMGYQDQGQRIGEGSETDDSREGAEGTAKEEVA